MSLPPRLTDRSRFTLGALALLGVTAAVLGGLRYPMYGDELHFWPSRQSMFANGFPGWRELRTYNELNTPLPFILFGLADRITGAGYIAGRWINLASALSVMLLIGAAGGYAGRAWKALLGLLLFPYFLFCSIYLYTDMIAVAFAVGGVYLALRGRHLAAAALLILGIASRQYIVVFPVSIVAAQVIGFRDAAPRDLGRRALPYLVAAATLAG